MQVRRFLGQNPHMQGSDPPHAVKRTLLSSGPSCGSSTFPVVGIGASAGGLEACRKLVSGLPVGTGIAFILVQHLDPTHESMMVDLLAGYTPLTVDQAADGMIIEPDHLYIIPPGTALSVDRGALRLSKPTARHGTRLPFDFLLRSLAKEYGRRAMCVILSGTGADGSLGLRAIRESDGFVVAQDPDEAGYDGMPRNAIMTGAVDLVLPAAEIAEALIRHAQGALQSLLPDASPSSVKLGGQLDEIIELLRSKTAHDFTYYKPGTLTRRIERRMALVGLDADRVAPYLEMLKTNTDEVELLAKDLLINVTSFFRDPKVFDCLAETVAPDLIRQHSASHPLRIWIAGCSTGEEAYSLAMLFHERIAAMGCTVKLQVFASDADANAVATAREGFYPDTISDDVSPQRLAQFFAKEDHGYRIVPELRASVVFSVQDVLTDPPFSRLDLISCRNLLIYLSPEAQAKVISLFHFALRQGGVLMLGSSETVGSIGDRFKVISKLDRLYRHIGRSRPGELGFTMGNVARAPVGSGQAPVPSRQAALAELCRRLVTELYAPAAVLINRKGECLYSLGPTDRYLHVAPGFPTQDLFVMVRPNVAAKLKSVIQRTREDKTSGSVKEEHIPRDGDMGPFCFAVHPVRSEDEDLFLISFIDDTDERKTMRVGPVAPGEMSRVAELEREVDALRAELRGASLNLEASNDEQRAINEEAMSLNEEYQSTNEELLASKEELQSLNEELAALNSHLLETLSSQRTLSNDLQNVLYSTNVATLFLDADLNIRFYTPATKSLFRVIPSDIGRPLADLHSLAGDGLLLNDARAALRSLEPIEREIETENSTYYLRRISQYRTQDDKVEGVVLTFTDVTERHHTAEALEEAKRHAERANEVKSHFLAAASHDLRQPLQTLILIQALLATASTEEAREELIQRLDETLNAMSGMLNTLLDIDRIDTGTVCPELSVFPLDDMMSRLGDEFAYLANAQGLELHVLPCSVMVCSDSGLLEQMIRNLLANALKFTKTGKILLGCRRGQGCVRIEVWDTGIGIHQNEMQMIFDEFHQIANPARDRRLGLGLGLSIVRRLANLLGHPIHVRSELGKGSTFTVEVARAPIKSIAKSPLRPDETTDWPHRTGSILIVEDDNELRELLDLALKSEGHRTVAVPDGLAALELVGQGTFLPDLILSDLRLPYELNGLQLGAKLRKVLRRDVPIIILTGDISSESQREIALQGALRLSKPVKMAELTRVIHQLLSSTKAAVVLRASPSPDATARTTAPSSRVFVVDDDRHIRQMLRSLLEEDGRHVLDFASGEAFLEAYRPDADGCLLIDAYLPGMSGFDVLTRLREMGAVLPAIMITGHSDVPMAVRAMKGGAVDFIEKPVGRSALLASIDWALDLSRDSGKRAAWRKTAVDQLASLTTRQSEILNLVLAGQPSKNIAADLGISRRTVETHRAEIMKRTGATSLPALTRLVLAAAWTGTDDS